jgi:hypothetical protein
MALGCYLVNLCPVPVNQLPARARAAVRSARTAGAVLGAAFWSFQPKAVVCVMKVIRAHVEQAIQASAVNPGGAWNLPFPAQGIEAGLRNVLAQVRLMH